MNAGREREIGARASRFLKAEMKRAGVTYVELAQRLEGRGIIETEASITSKLARGSFSASFLLSVAEALGLEKIDVGSLSRM